jgi:uncharacterized SAM-binding protein YcdF (DUF218 family)
MNRINNRRSLARRCGNAGLHRLWLLLAVALWSAIAVADDLGSHGISASAQERIAQLIQDALGPYRTDAESGSSATNGTAQHLRSVEASFREASRLMPARLDLRFGIASALILQAIQTNSQFDLNISNALAVYQEIRAMDTNGFEAPILYAAYSRAIGDENASDEAIRGLLAVHPQRTHEYLERFRRVEAILQMIPDEEPQKGLPTDRCHAIVVLGAALETNATVKAKLAGRLRQGLKVARVYPEAPLILTGGNQKSGITEAYVMSLWLKSEGVSSARLYLEDQARDTLGNALYSSAILERLGVTHVTLVTSANHIRRGLADLEEACLQRGLQLSYATLAAAGESEFDPLRERLAIYRDAMRASGLWAFPGIQR